MAVFRGSQAELERALVALPRAIAGLEPDPTGVAQRLQLRVGVTLLSLIQQAFIVKSRGGVGSDGIQWKPLKRETIAQRRITPGEKKAAGIKGKRVRGLLTPSQDKRWRQLFASRKARLVLRGMGEGAAMAEAAKFAWAMLKKEGAKTKLEVFGGRQVDIMRDTSRLFRSLTPGVEDRPSGAEDQVFETPTGAVIVGTNVEYAGRQHKMRPLWPEKIPAEWWAVIMESLKRGIVRLMGQYLASGRYR